MVSVSGHAENDSLVEPLSEREIEILALIADHLSNQEIAEQLHLSYGTVKWYTQQIYQKLGVHSRRQALVRAQQLGLLEKEHAPPVRSSNLPAQLTSFIGRAREMREIARLLAKVRLLTLTGPPGCGKTRLALETGHALLDHYPDGVWLVDLTQSSDISTIVKLIAESLGIVMQGDADVEKVLRDYLRSRHILLIFDNCEHIVNEAARLCLALLSACPQVTILATSQMHLGVPGEQEWLVPSLSLPLPEQNSPLPSLETLRQFESVRLFIERAAASLVDFRLTAENAPTVVHICQRLDGIPLAIELAAARIKLLTVREIAARLNSRFELLAAPHQLVSSRHQTLQAAIYWSFHLLGKEEQLLMSRLAVFTGAFTIEAVTAVCGFDPIQSIQVLELFGNLVDRSLVNVSHDEGRKTRYHLLDSVRLYGLARLSEEKQTQLKDRHLDFYAHMAHLFDQEQWGSSQTEWTDRLEAAWANIRAAVHWVLQAPEKMRLYKGMLMTANLEWFYRFRNHNQEPVNWMEEMLAWAETNEEPDWLAARAKGHYVLGILLFSQHYATPNVLDQLASSQKLWLKLGPRGRHGYAYPTIWISQLAQLDLSKAYQYLQECREIFQAENDPVGISYVILQEGQLAERVNNAPVAEAKFHELLSYANQIGNLFFIGLANDSLNAVYQGIGRNEEALYYADKAMEAYQQIGSSRLILKGLVGMSETHIALGNLEKAQELNTQIAAIQERMDIQFFRADIQYNRGEIAFLKSDFSSAATFFRRSSRSHYKRGYMPGFFAGCLCLAASVAEKNPLMAAQIFGFAKKNIGAMLEIMLHERTDRIARDRLNISRFLLGEADFERAMSEGAACTLDDLIPPEDSLQSHPTVALPAVSPIKLEKARFSGLTRREREIAGHIALGLSNSSIARELTISERTVTTHVTNILSKLNFSARTQIAAWAAEKGLTDS